MEIKLLVCDYDGVFTNDQVNFDVNGEIFKCYNIKDGMGIKMLKNNNIQVGVISGYKNNNSQKKILEHLNIDYISLGSNDKLNILKKWCNMLNITLNNVAYIGNDINDIEVMKNVYISGCPNDAHEECLKIATFISNKNGGEGCIRDFCEYVIKHNKTKKYKNNYDYKNGKITAIIPLRKGSVRCPNKNTKTFGDTNLLVLKIKVLKKVKGIDKIILSTDCPKAKVIGKILDIEVLDRPEYYCSSECPGNIWNSYIANQVKTEHIIYTPVTSPFISIQHFEYIIDSYKNINSDLYDCVITKNKLKEFLWMNNEPLNYKIEEFPRSQDLPDNIFSVNFGCNILPTKVMIERGYTIGYNPIFVNNTTEYNEIDIDTSLDFMTGEIIYNDNFKKNKKLNFIDVTIRDGGFINNWNWDYEYVVNLYNLISDLNYEYFELGYFLNDNLKEEGSGIWRNLPQDILKNFPKKKCKISVMIDYWKYNIENLKPQEFTKIDLIRITSYKEGISECIEYCKKVKKLGYKISLNLIVISSYTTDDLNDVINNIFLNHDIFDYLCIADSYGNMMPIKSNEILKFIISNLSCLNIPIGYHIHENIGNGFSNALEAINLHINYIDTSIYGLGRGCGNLSMNNILLYLNSINNIHIDDEKIKLLLKFCDDYHLDEAKKNINVIQGIYNIHPKSFEQILDETSLYNTFTNMKSLSDKEKYHYSNLN